MTIAVTGSSGFVGINLCNLLIKNKYNVIKLDRLNGFDLINKDDTKRIPKFDIIVHLAAKSFVPFSFEIPWEFYNNNILSTLNILEIARFNRAKVIFLSSYLYGAPQYLPIDEAHHLNPHNPYAQSKMICEMMCKGYSRDFSIPVLVFRPFNIYGPNQGNHFLIPEIINQANSGKIILKDPRPKRDFLFIDDVANAILSGIRFIKRDFEVFNLGSGQSHSVSDLADIITGLMKSNSIISYTHDYRQGEVLDAVADISKAYNLLGWEPKISINYGLEMIINSNNLSNSCVV
jgi:nucleoside-diphosphate-sugar epimerase